MAILKFNGQNASLDQSGQVAFLNFNGQNASLDQSAFKSLNFSFPPLDGGKALLSL